MKIQIITILIFITLLKTTIANVYETENLETCTYACTQNPQSLMDYCGTQDNSVNDKCIEMGEFYNFSYKKEDCPRICGYITSYANCNRECNDSPSALMNYCSTVGDKVLKKCMEAGERHNNSYNKSECPRICGYILDFSTQGHH